MRFLRAWLILPLLAEPWLAAASPALQETPAQRDARLNWWREARFGLFIHWGPVSLRGTEIGWSRGAQVPSPDYDQLYREFNPTNFNADAWARLAKDTGMKYLVLTTKHHDGFCLWESQFTDYHVLNSPLRRDVVKELAAACRRHGIVFCAYHSICDWWHPDYPMGSPGGKTPKPEPNMDRYTAYLRMQLAELLGNYGPLGILWFDGEWEKPWTPDRGADLYRWVRSLQPGIIINNRVGTGRAGMDGTTEDGAFGGDYDTPEQRVGKFQNDRPWESCITLCQQWAWKPNDRMKSLEECLRTLIYCAGGDGNLLFNVGPMPSGEIEPRQVERLREMGAWMKRYGHTIYQTRGGPFKPGRWGASTYRDNHIFLHVFQWPTDGLSLPLAGNKVRSARLLSGGKLEWQRRGDTIWLNVPPSDRHAIDTLIDLRLSGPASEIAPIAVGNPSLAEGQKATASNVFQRQAGYSAGKAFDGDPDTRWATDTGTREAWLAVDLGRPRTFSRVAIAEWAPGGQRVQSFALQARDGETWNTFFKGTTLGPDWERRLPPVTAQHVRLLILNATNGPTLCEFALHAE